MGEGGSKEAPPAAAAPDKKPAGNARKDNPKHAKEEKVAKQGKSSKHVEEDEEDETEVQRDKSPRGKSQKELAVDDDPSSNRVNYASSEEYWNKGAKNVKKVEAKGKKAKLHNTLNATLRATESVTDLKRNVKLPNGENEQEWIAVNLIHFYNSLNMIFNTLAEFCNDDEKCSKMSAGSAYEYLWKDNNKYKKPTRLPAKQYIDLLLNWANDRISDPNFLPVDDSTNFPPNFLNDVKDIFRRLFRVYAHIYYNHYTKIKELGASPHLNTCFKHYVIFAREFDLIPDSEFAPLKKLIDKFME